MARTENFRAVIGPQIMQGFAAQRSLRDDALRFRAVDQFPRLADRLRTGQGASEAGGEGPAAPDAFLVKWGKGDGTHGTDGTYGFWAV